MNIFLQRHESPETPCLLSLAIDHLRTHLLRAGGKEEESNLVQKQFKLRGILILTSHIQVQWSLLFYTLENYESELGDPELGQALVQLALATLVQQEVGMAQIELFLNRHFTCKVSKPLYTALLTGLERLVVAGIIRGRALDQVTLVSQFLQILENEQSK